MHAGGPIQSICNVYVAIATRSMTTKIIDIRN